MLLKGEFRVTREDMCRAVEALIQQSLQSYQSIQAFSIREDMDESAIVAPADSGEFIVEFELGLTGDDDEEDEAPEGPPGS